MREGDGAQKSMEDEHKSPCYEMLFRKMVEKDEQTIEDYRGGPWESEHLSIFQDAGVKWPVSVSDLEGALGENIAVLFSSLTSLMFLSISFTKIPPISAFRRCCFDLRFPDFIWIRFSFSASLRFLSSMLSVLLIFLPPFSHHRALG